MMLQMGKGRYFYPAVPWELLTGIDDITGQKLQAPRQDSMIYLFIFLLSFILCRA
jgi:hypothetical protein